ncbi:Glycosyltransferase, GT2 family [Streptoalloteichus tenebrarius]|uniref:Glycosyltransferase, GT2 family n=1 Tax=Streptoalloteichus tenebrarius (strain ATCC 17920 / DSM 40477 / JCM 4838 / CBS 697.72 / NBRC 16177 / NCIMB 11028 / NRRL B-12390 / A12253. 1 / ISP 5477) TaxID=1933 RepID=A0ABT1HT07_STRSD|nr:glycosyltransferase [Streptoalloteichus tenebrarius]MCP2258663.1 Glycosyltransferase, GT2 family [Streptoalloteichus tenebrarius]BFF02807.1 glycosyltransferase family 2 protein [Streptoalloteichus tenebrarius]
MSRRTPPLLRTAPVLAVVVCHDGEPWLPTALSALRRLVVRPRHVLAVDTGSRDDTARLLAEATEDAADGRLLDGVLTLGRDTGFGAAARIAVEHAVDRWGDPGHWVWLLHDDCAPEPDALLALLAAADASPSAAVLGPLALDWADPRLVVEAGLSADAAGHRRSGIDPGEPDWGRLRRRGEGSEESEEEPPDHGGRFEQSTEVLAVGSAGMLVRRDVWSDLGGFDPALPVLWDDVDFGWRANQAGHVVLCVPSARIRHARAGLRGARTLDALPSALRPPDGGVPWAADRAHGLRTFLTHCSLLSFLLGVPRLLLLSLLRTLGFAATRRLRRANAEWVAARYVFFGGARLLAGRRSRQRPTGAGRGDAAALLVGRITRLRNGFHRAVVHLVRRRVQADAALGRLPANAGRVTVWSPSEIAAPRRPVGPEGLPDGALGRRGRPVHKGLRRPPRAVVVPLDGQSGDAVAVESPRPSPVPRDGRGVRRPPDLVMVDLGPGRLAREFLLAPPVLLVAALSVLALATHVGRLGLDPAGGRLLPLAGLADTWGAYLASWHPVAGGTSAPAPPALAIVGVLGVLGGPPTAVALLLLAEMPLAGLAAYAATRRAPVRRSVRAVLAAMYALSPAAVAGVAEGRLDAVVVHLLLPPVLAGVVAVVRPVTREDWTGSWLSVAAGTALALAVIGAFSPLTHLVVVVVALAGFVALPGRRGDGRRRVVALFAVVLAPVAALFPWPAEVMRHPALLPHGVGAVVPEAPAPITALVTLHPRGAGGMAWVGAAVVLAALAVVVTRPRRSVLPGLAVAGLGALAAVVVRCVPVVPVAGGAAQVGWVGVPLLIVACGLSWSVLAACQEGETSGARWRTRRARRTLVPSPVVAVACVALVLALASSALLEGRDGPLRTTDRPTLAAPLAYEVERSGCGVLWLDDARVRLVAGRLPAFGDDDLAPVPSAPGRLERWSGQLRTGDRDAVRAGLAEVASAGVRFVVLPRAELADRLRELGGERVADAPSTTDGRAVLRVLSPYAPALLLSPEQAVNARTGGLPPGDPDTPGLVPVDAVPPTLAVRTSEGGEGRLLVVAAEREPGWSATVDGVPVPLATAWGHQVAAPVPARAAEVRLEPPGRARPFLLLVQLAVVVFGLVTAIPSRAGERGADAGAYSPSTTSGSRPR